MKHMFFFHKEEVHQSHPKVAASFWKTVVLVELTDLAFSIDSITTAVAMTDKLLIVWAGGIMGLICLRFMAQFFIKLLEKLPKLEDLAYQIVFFVGIKLTFDSFNIHIDHKSFWLTMGIISILGASILLRDHYLNKTQALFSDRLIARLKKGEMKVEEVLKLENIPNRVVHFLMERGTLEIKGTTP
jgi:predicted tellurium resistance membrane protein TerC